MNTTRRREFLGAALAGRAALVARGKSAAVEFPPRAMRPAQVPDSRVEILTGEPIGKICPDLYGHFVEHLGGVGYDGIWVDEDAKVPNIGGVRKELLSICGGSRRASCAAGRLLR
jgi:alpha-N-arabinofuranosidase